MTPISLKILALTTTQCGLPKKMALTLFEPFIIRRLKEKNICHTVHTARKMIGRQEEQVWDILEGRIPDAGDLHRGRVDSVP